MFLVCAFAVCIGAMGLWLLAKDLGVIAPDDIPASLNRSGDGNTKEAANTEESEGFLNYTFAIYDLEVAR